MVELKYNSASQSILGTIPEAVAMSRKEPCKVLNNPCERGATPGLYSLVHQPPPAEGLVALRKMSCVTGMTHALCCCSPLRCTYHRLSKLSLLYKFSDDVIQ